MTEHAHHLKQHTDIIDRLQWLAAGSLLPARKRHATRQTAWAIRDHLHCCHGVRHIGYRPPIRDLATVHQLLHEATA